MNSTLRTRFFVVMGSATLVGVLAGTATAYATQQAPAPRSGSVEPGCAAVAGTATLEPGAQDMWFGPTHHTAR